MTYIENYDQMSTLWLVTVGFQRHGKSCFIGSLTEMLENISIVWKSTSSQYLDDYTFRKVIDIREQMLQGQVPDPTPQWTRQQPAAKPAESTASQPVLQPLLMHTYKIPEFGSHCLVTYDIAGQYFNSPNEIRDEGYLRSLNAVKNIWFFVALDKMFSPDNTLQINQLLQVYLSGMIRMGWSLQNRNLIVIYTQADKYINFGPDDAPYLPDEIRKYYESDPFAGLLRCRHDRNTRKAFQQKPFEMDVYLSEMQQTSDILRQYTIDEVPGGQGLISLAQEKNLGLEFCIVSSLGTDPTNGILPTQVDPHRVLDPFLWALKMNQGNVDQKIKLVLDPTLMQQDQPQGQINSDFFNSLYEKIQSFDREVNTYYLGNPVPASIAGQRLPTQASTLNNRTYIGPIIDWGNDNEIALVLTTKPITDLEDYHNSSWENRLLLVSVSENPVQKWKQALTLRNASDLPVLLNKIQQMLQSPSTQGRVTMAQNQQATTVHPYELDYDENNIRLYGFPLIRIPKMNFLIQLLPVTKVQFEYFLCDQPDPYFNESTFNDLLSYNPRISPSQITLENYWNIFLTAIKPEEVKKFALWLGEGYQIPSKDQWYQIYDSLQSLPYDENLFAQIASSSNMPERTKTILKKLEEVNRQTGTSQPKRLVDQLFMRYGVMEWVMRPDAQTEWGGMGYPSSKFQSVTYRPEQNQPEIPRNVSENRLKHYGFRLIKRIP
jgi:hypothetical protein